MGNMVLAAASYTKAITSLKSVLLTLGSAIGAVMLVYGGIKFAMAFRQMDQQGEHQAVYSVVAGGVLVGLSALITALPECRGLRQNRRSRARRTASAWRGGLCSR